MDLIIRLKARSGKSQELSQSLEALHGTICTAHGCRESSIYRDMNDDETLLLTSQWENNTAFEMYMQSKHGGIFLGGIDLLGEKVEIWICKNVHKSGIETLKQMRTGL